MGRRGIRILKEWVGCECCISRRGRWARLSSIGIPAGGILGGSRGARRCEISRRSRDAAKRAALGVRAAKSSGSRKGE